MAQKPNGRVPHLLEKCRHSLAADDILDKVSPVT